MLSPLAPNTTQELLNQIAKLEQQLHKQPGSNETGTCISTNHAEVEGNDTILTAMIIIVTGIIIVTISFEWAKEEWERRMHASLKAVVKNVFSELTILGFIGLIMFLTTKLGKERLDHLAYAWFNQTCFKSDLWCEDDEKVLVCPENVLIELTENVHIVLFLIMLLFLIEAVLVIRTGKRKMRQWKMQEEFCLSNSLGVAAARVLVSAEHFEAAKWWSCGCYDGNVHRWLCGCYPRSSSTSNKIGSVEKGDAADAADATAVDVYNMNTGVINGSRSGPGEAGHQCSTTDEGEEDVWDVMRAAKHFETLPEGLFFICPCKHARTEYMTSRNQIRYSTMRTGFINAHNQRMKNSEECGEETVLPTSFDFAEYMSHILGEHLAEMVDVSPANWLTLWVAFLLFMIFDFVDLWNQDDGYFLTQVSVVAAYVSCCVLFIIRNDTIHIEHALLNDAFMSFHVSHGLFGKFMCSCCFNAKKIRAAHHKALHNKLYEAVPKKNPIKELARKSRQQKKEEEEKQVTRVRRVSMFGAAVQAASFAARLRRVNDDEVGGGEKKEGGGGGGLHEPLLRLHHVTPAERRPSFTPPETKRGGGGDGGGGGEKLGSILLDSDEDSDDEIRDSVMSLPDLGGHPAEKKIKKNNRRKQFKTKMTAPSIDVDPAKLHRFDTHKVDFNHENHHPAYRWRFNESTQEWQEVPLEKGGAGWCRCIEKNQILNHHQRLFFFGQNHRHFLFNYVRMSLLLLAVYMGAFCIQFGTNVVHHFNEHGTTPPETNDSSSSSSSSSSPPSHVTNFFGPILFYVVAFIPVIIHDAVLPDIVAKIVQTTKVEQMIDTKHVQRVVAMMKAKNALMVLHNMSSFMHHIDDEALQARNKAKQVLGSMPGLEHLNDNETKKLLDACRPITFLKGMNVVEVGNNQQCMYIIVTGSIGKSRPSHGIGSYPNRRHGTHIYEAGSFFGSTAMILDRPVDYNAQSLSSKSLLFELSHDDARRLLPDDTWSVLEKNAKAVHDAELQPDGDDKDDKDNKVGAGGGGGGQTSGRTTKHLRKRSSLQMESEIGFSVRARKESLGTVLLDPSLIVPLPKRARRKQRHLRSALQMFRELAMHSTFRSIDADGGGTISMEELTDFFRQLFPPNHPYHLFHVDQVNVLGKELDLNGNGEISETEFHDFLMPIIVHEDSMGDPEDSARRMFQILDSQGSVNGDGEGNGRVTTKKFKDLLNLFGMSMSYEEVRELFHEYDEDFDGYLDEEEFVRMMIESGVEG